MKPFNQILVIGASGKTGIRVMRGLRAQGLNPKGASRHGDVTFDWNAADTWAPALNDIDAVYVTYYPDLALPEAPGHISQFCTLAKLKGVKHITLLSGRGEPLAQTCENIVKQSGLGWTIVRASWFNQNFSEGMFRQYIATGHIALPVDSMSEPFVDADDIAEVVIESLTDSRHQGELYEVTGPELLSFADLAKVFSQELGRQVLFESIPLEDFQSQLTAAQVEEGAIAALTYLFTEVLDGRNQYVCDGIQRALGRPAKNFAQYIRDNFDSFSEAA